MRNAIRSILYSYASLLMPHCPVTVVQRLCATTVSLTMYNYAATCHRVIITAVSKKNKTPELVFFNNCLDDNLCHSMSLSTV